MLEKGFLEDFNFFITKYEEIFPLPYYCFSKEQTQEYARVYLEKNDIENELEFLYFLKCVVKNLNGILDSHTAIKKNGQFFPFVLKMFDDDIYVVKTIKQNEYLLYCKLVSVNGIPYKKLIPEIEDIISYSTEGWRKRCIERSFNELYSLLQLPSISPENNNVILEFENINKEKVIFKFKEDDYQEAIPYDKENGFFEIFDNTVHYIYNSCRNKEMILDSLNRLKNAISNEKINSFILDLRGNNGGDDSIILPLINYLKELNIKAFTFVDRYTFSSGIGALMDSLKIGAVVIGEDVGSSINHFGSCSEKYILPNTSFKLMISTKFIDESVDGNSNYKNLKPIMFRPNIVVHETIDDFINNKDLCMEEFKRVI